jgi:ubiquinone/menaquinone biosynthesis C-methylase UbiE
MIEQARARQQAMGLTNMDWQIGDVQPLPFPEASFSAAVNRYSFHHFLDPKGVLSEIVRACKPNGEVTVVDVFASSAEQGEAYGGNSGDTHLIRVVFWFWTGLLRFADTTYDLLQPSEERLVPERSTGADVLAQVSKFLFGCGTFEERVPVADHRQQPSNLDQAIVPA